MGLFGMFGTKTKSDYDAEIAQVQGEIARLKISIAQAKEHNRTVHNGTHIIPPTDLLSRKQGELASLKAARAKAPK